MNFSCQLAWPQPQLASPASTWLLMPTWAKATTVFVLGLCVCLSVSPRIAYLFNMDYLQASNHETSLANYYTFTLDNLRPMSNGHLSMQHLSWRHLSISAISQLLLPWFFKIIKPHQQIITNELPWSNTPGQKGLILNIVTSPSPLLSYHVHPHLSPALSLDNSTNNN